MSSGVRAATSAVMLSGFLLVAVLQLGLVGIPVLALLLVLPATVAAQVGVPLLSATVGVMTYATWRALYLRRSVPAGVPVARADAPQLWALLDEAARSVGTRAPDTVTVVADAAITLSERSRLLGLVGGRRDLYLGLPLLQAWDVAQLRAVVAHEVAHGSARGGRFAPMAYRGRVAVGRIVPRISRRNLAGPLLLAYARLYRRVDRPFSRGHELAADRSAAEFAGPQAAAAVLRDLPLLVAAQRLFYAEYLGPGWQAGHVPDDIFGGFLRVLAARAGELAAMCAREPVAEPLPWDTHPSSVERLTALAASFPNPEPVAAAADAIDAATGEARPDPSAAGPTGGGPSVAGSAGAAASGAGAGAVDGVAAGDLVPDLPGLGQALQEIAFPPQGRTSLGWDEFFGAARTSEMQREADAALGTLSRAAGTPLTHAGDVFDLAADGRLRKAAETVFPELPPEASAERIAELVRLLLALAALRCKVARWRHSWMGTAELVAVDGAPFDLDEIAFYAISPETVGVARELAAQIGVDLTSAGDPGDYQNASRGEVVGGLVNLVVDGARTDLLILDTGLVLFAGLPRSQNGSAKRRLARLAAADEAARQSSAPGSRFVPYEDVIGAAQTRRTPKSWELRLREGGTLALRSALGCDELPGGWAALDEAITFLSRPR